jgi:hypothetical protein
MQILLHNNVLHNFRIPGKYYLQFLDNSTKNRSEILIRNFVKSRDDTWRATTGAYRFGWITPAERWIKRWSDGSDRRVPLHLSDSIRNTGSRSDGRKSRREGLIGVLGFRRGSDKAAARRWSSAMFQGLPNLADGWTACRTSRRIRLLEPRRQSRPEKEGEGGWSSAQRRFASVVDGGVDSLRIGTR